MVSRDTGVPVGLLGAHRNTRFGVVSWMALRTPSGVREKSLSRLPTLHEVPVDSAIIGCIE
jgi:hypothetical protein